jgi:hypothetical protein
MHRILLTVISAFILMSCAQTSSENRPDQPFAGPSPWPDIRSVRIQTLLPEAMERANVDAWAVLCRSNNNDPLALHVGCENAVAPAVYLFERVDDGVQSTVFTPPGEATALQELGLHDQIEIVERTEDPMVVAAEYIIGT